MNPERVLFYENFLRDFVASEVPKIKEVVASMTRLQLAEFLAYFAQQFPQGAQGLAGVVHAVCEARALKVFVADQCSEGGVE